MYVHMYGNVYSTVLGQVEIDERLERTVMKLVLFCCLFIAIGDDHLMSPILLIPPFLPY